MRTTRTKVRAKCLLEEVENKKGENRNYLVEENPNRGDSSILGRSSLEPQKTRRFGLNREPHSDKTVNTRSEEEEKLISPDLSAVSSLLGPERWRKHPNSWWVARRPPSP
ncbi:hypothetical protein J6590_028129 [Homalodisca vitripennis]|nr:hypothetical protein J6590_028129 [Homalodisca vitripennis]